MSSIINVTNIVIKNNPANFLDPFLIHVTFEAIKPIPDEIEWKVVYFGDSREEKFDQLLDTINIGPLEPGEMEFDWEFRAPDPEKIPTRENLLGVTAIILTVSYHGKEFFRVGYFVYNYYAEPEALEDPNLQLDIAKVQRSILADKPRITKTEISWGGPMDMSGMIEGGFGGGEGGFPLMENGNLLNQGPTGVPMGAGGFFTGGMAANPFGFGAPPQPAPGMDPNNPFFGGGGGGLGDFMKGGGSSFFAQ